MAIVFPASPSVNETFTAGSITYKWDGDKWIGLGVTPADRLIEGSNSLEITASNELQWTGGNVGIGTDPTRSLHLHNTSGSILLVSGTVPQLRFNSDPADGIDGERAIIGLSTGTSTFMPNTVDGDLVIRSESGKDILFGNGTIERVRIRGNGELVVKGPVNPADYTLSDGIFVQPSNGLSGLTITSGSATNNAYINFSKGTASNAEQFGFAIGRDGTTNQGMIKIDDVDVVRFGGTNSSVHMIGNHVGGQSAVKIQRTDNNISSLGFYDEGGTRDAIIYSNPSDALVLEVVGSLVMAPANGSIAGTFGSTGLSFPSGKGINFSANANAAGMTSELLDDYEEGTFTPTISFTSGSATVANAVCGYIKVGRLVHVSGRFTLTSVVSPSGELTIGGLPFTADNLAGDGNRAGIQIFFENATTAIGTDIVGLVLDNTTIILVRASGTTGSGATLAGNVGASTMFLFGGTYRSA